MAIEISLIRQLRERTGVGMMDAKRALEETGGDSEKAVEYLKKQGQKVAAKKQNRETREGIIGAYVHANGKVAAVIAIACESDFVAKTEEMKELAHDIAMQIAATDPAYLTPADVPVEILDKEKEIFKAQLEREGKPEHIREKIIEGKVQKFYSAVCLSKQPFIKDDQQTIEQLIHEKIMKLGENIQLREYKRIAL
ncbi:MAG: translation elongation factor Ts [Patescibacteria group bacterium]